MPGYTLTERLQELQLDAPGWPLRFRRQVGTPAGLGAVAAFLASDPAGYVTGQAIACDGGLLQSIEVICPITGSSSADGRLRGSDEVWKCLADFRLPDSLGFGLVAAPVMYSATFEGGQWKQGELLPYGPIELMPGARALHFAEQVFEGMKAYRVGARLRICSGHEITTRASRDPPNDSQ